MPLSKYFEGHGKEVMSKMKSRYGSEKGERVFYATENKRKKPISPSWAYKAPKQREEK